MAINKKNRFEEQTIANEIYNIDLRIQKYQIEIDSIKQQIAETNQLPKEIREICGDDRWFANIKDELMIKYEGFPEVELKKLICQVESKNVNDKKGYLEYLILKLKLLESQINYPGNKIADKETEIRKLESEKKDLEKRMRQIDEEERKKEIENQERRPSEQEDIFRESEQTYNNGIENQREEFRVQKKEEPSYKKFFGLALVIGVLLLGYWAYLALTPEVPVRIWPSESPSSVCNGFFGDSYPPTGPNSATYFNFGGCGSWKIFYVVPGGELSIFSFTGGNNNQLGVQFNKWDVNYYIDDFFDGQWNQMKFVPQTTGGTDLVNYIPRGSKIRIRTSDNMHVIVEQKKPLPNWVENLKLTPIPTPTTKVTPRVAQTPKNTPTPISTVSFITTSADQKTITNSIGMEFLLISSGEFDMGSPLNEAGRDDDDEGPVHNVTISKAFYMGKYEVTQKQWRDIMGGDPSCSSKGDNLPVECVSWNSVQEFIKMLNEKEGSNKYRLPSEAEWEYAARAGTTTRYSFGDDESKLGDYAWYRENSDGKTHDVGQKKPNPWGLYDIHGNVREWVQDIYQNNYNGAPTNGSAWENGYGSNRVFRDCGPGHNAVSCRSSVRFYYGFGGARDGSLGFRLLRVL